MYSGEDEFDEIVMAAAGECITVAELTGMIQGLTAVVRAMNSGADFFEVYRVGIIASESRKSIRKSEVCCLECGRCFRIITAKHLEKHGITKKQYLEKYAMGADTRLVARDLSRERSLAMMERKLWQRPVRDNEHEK